MKLVFGCRVESYVTAELDIPDEVVSIEDKIEFIARNFKDSEVLCCEPDSTIWSKEDILLVDGEWI